MQQEGNESWEVRNDPNSGCCEVLEEKAALSKVQRIVNPPPKMCVVCNAAKEMVNYINQHLK